MERNICSVKNKYVVPDPDLKRSSGSGEEIIWIRNI